MAKRNEEARDKAEDDKPLFRVRPTKQARRESKVGGSLFKTAAELLWVISQLKLLRHWPLDSTQQQSLGSDLDFSTVQHHKEKFYELRLDDERLHQKNLRVFFWVHDKSRTIWIVDGYWKKTNRLDDVAKARVARRIKNIKGGIQDGSIK